MHKRDFNNWMHVNLQSILDDLKQGVFDEEFEKAIDELISTASSGQSEYALNEDAFDNFNRLGDELDLPREKVLFVYMKKHLDGIVSYLKGHRSQREPVQGRMKDVIVYMLIMWAMTNESESSVVSLSDPSSFKAASNLV